MPDPEAQTTETEASIYAELAGAPAEAAPEAAPVAESPPVVVAAEPPPPAAPPPQDLAAVVAQMVRREAAEAQRIAALPPPPPRYRDTLSAEELRHNPVEALRSAGVAPEQIAQYLVAELAPHASTPEARARLQMAPELQAVRQHATQEIASLRAEMDQMRAQERTREYERSLHTFASGVSPAQYPLIGRFAQEDADGLAKELLDVVQAEARTRYLAGESGPPMDLATAAQTLEARYATYQRRLAPPTTAAPGPASGAVSTSAVKPAPAATASKLSGAPPARPAARTLEEIEREIQNEVTAMRPA